MKKLAISLSWIVLVFGSYAQNVGINTTTPLAHLDIHGNNTRILLTDDGSGNNASLSRYTNRLEIGVPDIFQVAMGTVGNPSFIIMPNGNIGIGNNTPINKLQIGTPPGFSGNDLAIGNGAQGMSFYQHPSASIWYSNTNFSLLPNSGIGYVGIGTLTPSTKLQVLTADANYGITQTNGTVSIGTYIGSNAGWLGTQSNHPLYFFANNSNALMSILPNGYVGIGNIAPVNKLQIGTVPGYSGNDIAFGNGVQASAIAQTVNTAWWYSNTNIALMPMGNGHGRVGINTLTPSVPLEVDDYVSTQALLNLSGTDYGGFDYFRVGGYNGGINSWAADVGGICHTCYASVSIYAYGNVMATEFDAISDARMKDLKGVSNSANDLVTINAIQVTDYTLKDKVKNGDRPFKKVVAQQVESVYPQVVSRHIGFIPNVYQAANKISKTDGGYILTFENGHHLSKVAKKIKLLTADDNTMKQYNIAAILSDKEVLITANDLNRQKVFVYGEEVNDFRTVDYEGLTTLNISATQELSKQLSRQQATIQEQTDKIKQLSEKVEMLIKEVSSLQQK